jgi:hypothetical protein
VQVIERQDAKGEHCTGAQLRQAKGEMMRRLSIVIVLTSVFVWGATQVRAVARQDSGQGDPQTTTGQKAKQDAKDTGHDTKNAAKDAAKTAKNATKKGVNEGAKGVKKGANKTAEGADKLKDKTDDNSGK